MKRLCIKGETVKVLAVFGLIAGTMVVSGRDLTWTGSASSVWDLTALNWSSGGTACAFAVGDNALIDMPVSMTFGSVQLNPTTLTVANTTGTVDFDFRGASSPFVGTSSFVKDGAGMLNVHTTSGGAFSFSENCLLTIRDGVFAFGVANGAGNYNPHNIHVAPGGTLRVTERNSLGNAWVSAPTKISLEGTLEFKENAVGGYYMQSLGELMLDGGTILASTSGSGSIGGILMVLDKIAVTGTTDVVLTPATGVKAAREFKVARGPSNPSNYAFLLNPKKNVEFHVERVATADDVVDLAVTGPVKTYATADMPKSGFDKTGNGVLYWNQTSYTDNRCINGDINIRSGKLILPRAQICLANNDQTFYVGTNATLVMPLRNAISTAYTCAAGEYPKTKFHIDHGTFVIGDGVDNFGCNFAGKELVLDTASFQCNMQGASNAEGGFGALVLGDKLVLKSDLNAPYVFSAPSGRQAYAAYHFFAPTEINVADITGDSGSDAIFNVNIRNYVDQRLSGNTVVSTIIPSGFKKTGAGTVQFAAYNNTYWGDCEICEGTVLLDKADYNGSTEAAKNSSYSFLGNTASNRVIAVRSGATLDIRHQEMLRTASLGIVDDYKLHFIFDGGTLRLADKAVNMFGPLTFKNATIAYQGGWGGSSGLGILHMTGDVTVQGTQPVTLPPATESSYLYLNTTNFVVDVEEPQGLFTIGLTVQHAISTPVNFTKRGAGAVCFASPNPKFNAYRKYIDGRASVESGTLIVDTLYDLSAASTIDVASGATIGGTGVVRRVTVAAGGGFYGKADQTEPLAIRGNLTIGANPIIHIDNPNGIAEDNIKAKLFTASDTVTGAENLNNATVYLGGVAWDRGKYVINYKNGTLAVKSAKGTILIIQ